MMDRGRRRERVGKLTFLVISLGLVITGADLFSSLRGWEICPYEGCRLSLDSPYSHLLGIPLSALGLGFFFVALLLVAAPRRWMLYWSSLGLGSAIYFLYLQRWVLGKMCIVCVAVEVLVFILFLSSFTRVSLWCVLSLIVLAFLGVHTVYTWTPEQKEACLGNREMDMLRKFYTTKGGEREAVFFFSLDCPACSEALPLVKKWASREKVRVVFREVMVHDEEQGALYLLSLLKGGMDPWEALRMVEKGKKMPQVSEVSREEKRVLLRLVAFNGILLRSMGLDGVPVLIVAEEGKVEARQGLEGIKRLVSPPSSLGWEGGYQGAGAEDLGSPLGGVCTPSGCGD